jgi:type IV pilus biogenesis protein PilP
MSLPAIASSVESADTSTSDAESGKKIGETIRRMNEEMIVNSTRIRQLQQQRELLQIQSEVEALEMGMPINQESGNGGTWKRENDDADDEKPTPEPIPEPVVVEPVEPVIYRPVIQEILGKAPNIYATLIETNGRRVTVKLGDTVAKDWKVVSINVGSVNISRGEEQVSLKFGRYPSEPF